MVHLVLGFAVIGLNLGAGALGAFRWWRAETSRSFWPLARAGQAAVVVQVLLGGSLVVLGYAPDDDLHYVYGALPVAASFVAEQLRVGAAETVLEARGIVSAQAVGDLPEPEQRSVVLAIMRREMGVMAMGALVVAALALRAAFVSGGL